ncbi:MAG: helix-turn-helix transcriptional regulator [Planctomycetes bacterium]|nr:helix-turn-helix transcriptional regulator [Planctomycetota bacterium]
MQVAVKEPRTKRVRFRVTGAIPRRLLSFLEAEYRDRLEVEIGDEESVNVFETPWYQRMKKTMNPGIAVRVYRENRGLSQRELGRHLGGLSRQNVSDMERGTRGISKAMAKKLAAFFDVPVERFI